MWICLTLGWLTAGCCSHPGIFQKVQSSLETVQSYYGPLVEEVWQPDKKVKLAVVAADTALLLAGELQSQWCPEPGKAEQLDLQVQAAGKLAQEAGLAAAGTTGTIAPEKAGP
jgi:hypothetical protein